MGITRSQKHNKMMDKVYSEYEKNKKDPSIKSFKRHQVKLGKALPYKGDQYPGPKHSALKKKTGNEQHKWLDKHVDAQKKAHGPVISKLIRGVSR